MGTSQEHAKNGPKGSLADPVAGQRAQMAGQMTGQVMVRGQVAGQVAGQDPGQGHGKGPGVRSGQVRWQVRSWKGVRPVWKPKIAEPLLQFLLIDYASISL